MCGGEVLLLQGLDQVWAVLGVNAPEGTFSTGLVDRTESAAVPHGAALTAQPARRERATKTAACTDA